MKRIKRAAAGFLAAAMLLTGTLAMSASAAVSDDYKEMRTSVEGTSDAAEFYSTYDALFRKYPDSPELYYERAVYRWYYDETAKRDEATRQLVLNDLDAAIGLALQSEHPYQEYGYDYAEYAASMKVELYRDMLGAQDKVIEAEQQHLDLWDRGFRIRRKEAEDESERSYCDEYLNKHIPKMRAELEKIRSWYAAGSKSYTAWANAGDDPYYGEGDWYKFKLTGSAGSKTVKISAIMGSGTPHEHVYTFSQPVQSIQRSLRDVTIFVPRGTTVHVQDGTKNKDSYIGKWGSKKYTFDMTMDEYDYSSSGQGDDFTAAPYIVHIVLV